MINRFSPPILSRCVHASECVCIILLLFLFSYLISPIASTFSRRPLLRRWFRGVGNACTNSYSEIAYADHESEMNDALMPPHAQRSSVHGFCWQHTKAWKFSVNAGYGGVLNTMSLCFLLGAHVADHDHFVGPNTKSQFCCVPYLRHALIQYHARIGCTRALAAISVHWAHCVLQCLARNCGTQHQMGRCGVPAAPSQQRSIDVGGAGALVPQKAPLF